MHALARLGKKIVVFILISVSLSLWVAYARLEKNANQKNAQISVDTDENKVTDASVADSLSDSSLQQEQTTTTEPAVNITQENIIPETSPIKSLKRPLQKISDSIESITIEPMELQNAYITYYGWPDNSPAGSLIAYPSSRYSQTIHIHAGGDGSYDNPITFASNPELFDIGTIIYVPYIQKYIIMEDRCVSCIKTWEEKGEIHIDIWMESNEDYKNELIRCQYKLTRPNTNVEIDPPSYREVSGTPLFDNDSGSCFL